VPPDHAIDADEDGRPDLAAYVRMGREDVLRPEVLEVATFEGGAYRNDTSACKSWHLRQLAAKQSADAGVPGPADSLRSAVERAWHGLRAGQPGGLEQADVAAAARAPLGPGLAQSWVRWRGWLSEAAR
jgi:hypothetical protein